MAKRIDFRKDLLKALRDPKIAIEHLSTALKIGGPRVFLLALYDIIEAYLKELKAF